MHLIVAGCKESSAVRRACVCRRLPPLASALLHKCSMQVAPPPRGRQGVPYKQCGASWFADGEPGHDECRAEEGGRSEPVAREGYTEDCRPHRLERQRERGLGCAYPSLGPVLSEEGEGAREDAGDRQG